MLPHFASIGGIYDTCTVRWQTFNNPIKENTCCENQTVASGWNFSFVMVKNWLFLGSNISHTTPSTRVLATYRMLMKVLHASCKSLPAYCASCFPTPFICRLYIIANVYKLSGDSVLSESTWLRNPGCQPINCLTKNQWSILCFNSC